MIWSLGQVVRVYEQPADALVELQIASERIQTTPEHPFWLDGFGWRSAAKLKAGDVLKVLRGDPVVVRETKSRSARVPVYNIEVADFHTYFVSEAAVLVHNACTPFTRRVNLAEENILYREDVLYQGNIDAVRPFNQVLSDARQPIRAVRTREGLHIMQGNHRFAELFLTICPLKWKFIRRSNGKLSLALISPLLTRFPTQGLSPEGDSIELERN